MPRLLLYAPSRWPGGRHKRSPKEISLAPGVDRTLTFAAEGLVRCARYPTQENGPDGGTEATGGTNICSYNGISGITYGPESGPQGSGKTMFLAGVFLDNSEPQTAPARLDFSATSLTDSDHNRYGEDFLELRPEIGQVFFIGNGLTQTDSPPQAQVFHVPDEATRLFLGFADSYNFGLVGCNCPQGGCTPSPNNTSLAGYYGDNGGELIVTVLGIIDCNNNDVDDQIDISSGFSQDCRPDGIPDECQEDCNGSGYPDYCDIRDGRSHDCNGTGIPDECETDCNNNGYADSCDIETGRSQDCNVNGQPDECEGGCDGDGYRTSVIPMMTTMAGWM